ncbi:hypothetical protein UFOVP1518_39 [uncultured Caudovirales phage]|jgi:hypothetical protein|uniref:Uncharacterized protein n=1 Tax=uncultured Caudovirales phage TaxID=2100421 RepID=A0A6J5RB52_9CAUD|nr:hypothetical protein UFOVP475_52 [uncultured Caudovirales phage]CAB4169352.1 hypothetical protein UFOVP897_14 [uncultured Caudovirales phage]CAB4175862.1 hypothetical protein UFOVP984_52 [uncultured Caudovirales phage]CAB4181251.1 hypothetical protein UFOVP1072_21 [uncultured Caudovirales phage]CAB4191587.1 hypothetical protein UFOVP1211_51 [uncultured Caudovirales phage]
MQIKIKDCFAYEDVETYYIDEKHEQQSLKAAGIIAISVDDVPWHLPQVTSYPSGDVASKPVFKYSMEKARGIAKMAKDRGWIDDSHWDLGLSP